MTSGASTMPTKTLAAADTPTAPPSPIVRCSAHANARTISGITPQWNSTADSAAMISTSGSARNASTKLAAGFVTAYGVGPPPRWPKTKPVPAASALLERRHHAVQARERGRQGGIFSSARASRAASAMPLATIRHGMRRRSSDSAQHNASRTRPAEQALQCVHVSCIRPCLTVRRNWSTGSIGATVSLAPCS